MFFCDNIPNNPDWRNNSIAFVTGEQPGKLVMKAVFNKSRSEQFMAWQFYFGDKIAGRKSELTAFNSVVVRARSDKKTKISIGLVMKDGKLFSAEFPVDTEFSDIRIPLNQFRSDSLLLLPRPYPGFQPLWFLSDSKKKFDMLNAEKLIISLGKELSVNDKYTIEVASVLVTKK